MKGAKNRKIFELLGRKQIIIGFIILIIVLVITTISLIVEAIKENKTENIVYTEGSFVGYNVFLKENDFFEKNYLEQDRQYIASLIDYIDATFRYEFNSSDTNKNYKYKYKIVAETNVADKTNHNSIYRLNEDIVREKVLEFNSSKKLEIKERIKIDYNKYNEVVKNFIGVYGLNDITPTVTIKMYVGVEGVTKGTNYTRTPVATLTIPLTTRTIAIDIESNSVNATEISVYKDIANKENLYISILTSILIIMIIIELCIYTKDTKDDTAVYKMRIKKLMQNYGSYIQKMNNEFDYEGYQQLEMKTFEDLLQIRDTISEPILMVEKKKEEETDFLVPTKSNVIYVYKLRKKDIKKEREEKKKQKENKK